MSWSLAALIAAQLGPLAIVRKRGGIHFLGLVLLVQFFFFDAHRLSGLLSASSTPAAPHAADAEALVLMATVLTSLAYFACRSLSGLRDWRVDQFRRLQLTAGQIAVLVALVAIDLRFEESLNVLRMPRLLLQCVLVTILFVADGRSAKALSLGRALIVLCFAVRFLYEPTMIPLVGLGLLWLVLAIVHPSRQSLLRLFILVVSVLALQSLKGEFRSWTAKQPGELTLQDRARGLLSITSQNLAAKGAIGAAGRFGDDSLDRVIALTPHYVPFWKGRTYRALAWAFVPRALWREKPSWGVWNDFGRRYLYLRTDDAHTSVAFHYLSEGYLNYGMPGFAAAAIAFGILLALIEILAGMSAPGMRLLWFTVLVRPFLIPVDTFSLLSQVAASAGLCLTALTLTHWSRTRRKGPGTHQSNRCSGIGWQGSVSGSSMTR